MTRLTGYADPLCITAGEPVDFMISGEAAEADIRLVRLIHGDTNPLGPGFVEQELEAELPRTLSIDVQRTQHGAFARVPDTKGVLCDLPAGTIYAFVRPSRPGSHEQAIAGCWAGGGQAGYLLLIDSAAKLCFRLGDGTRAQEITLPLGLAPDCWYFVAATWDVAAGKLSLIQRGRVGRWNSRIGPVAPYEYDDSAELKDDLRFAPASGSPFIIAGTSAPDGTVSALFNGKIDRPGLQRRSLDKDALAAIGEGGPPPAANMVAHWDTSAGYTDHGIDDVIRDVGPNSLHAFGVNRPIRGMTGWNWKGREDCFRLDPSQYGGIAFHDDALTDCAWKVNVRLETSADMRSGVYALRVRSKGAEDHLPFFVRAAKPKARIAVLMPTFTYLAYANEQMALEGSILQAVCGTTTVITGEDLRQFTEETFGRSTYDVHSDGAGVCYSSWRRPIFNMRPRHRMTAMGVPWAFPADLSLIWWLETAGYEYEILTDHDLHRDGLAALSPYKAIINCTHPEYYSCQMLDAVEDYVCSGGRLLYLGGNGFYWVTSTRADEPWCIEVRKLDSGIRAWQAFPGEGYLTSTGERSGLWRARGRAPQKIVGVGFTTEGMDESKPFERMPDSFDPRVAWIFEGIGPEELIGDFGLALGGASGLEMDRYDLALGTPPHTLLLAASFDHSDNYPLVPEETLIAFPGRGGTQDPQVRGDMTFFTTPNGGAIFAAGSIAWSQALPCNGGNNNVGRIVRNVLDVFCSDGPIPGVEAS